MEHTATQKLAYGRIIESLLKEGEAYHNGTTFELNSITHCCEVSVNGELIDTLDTTEQIFEYC